jgi:hypothetical protein
MKESALVRKIIKAVKAKYKNAYVRKLSDRFTRGIPDILIITESMDSWSASCTLLVETKNKSGRQEELQKLEINSICEAGGQAIFAVTVDAVLEKLEEMNAIE